MIARILKFVFFVGVFFFIAGISTYLTLTFFISSDADIVVPDLSGKHVVTALELLSDLSLNTKVKGLEYSADIPMHHVIFQDPSPGSEIKPGRDVRITLSKGRKSIIVPSIVGISVNQARIVLGENGLVSGNMSKVYQDRTSEGVVLAQIPSPGKTIDREQPVNLLISLGKRPSDFMMPDLSGMSIVEAMIRIEKEQLTLGKIHSSVVKDRPVDKIIDQFPSPGHRVFANDPVNLTINRKTVPEGNVFTVQNGLLLFRHRTEPGFLNRHIRVRLNSFGLSLDLLDEFIKPGKDVWCFIPTEPNTTAFLYEEDKLIKSKVIE